MLIVSHPFSVTFSITSELKYISFQNYFTSGTEALAWGHEFNPQSTSHKAKWKPAWEVLTKAKMKQKGVYFIIVPEK